VLPPERVLELRAKWVGLPFVTERLMRVDSIYHNPVEWAGTMPGMNWATIGPQAQWTLRDHATGKENGDIAWRFRKGDLLRLRLVNVRETLHAMQHPIHLHGQRFLILAVNGVPNDDPAWKDTVLVPAGAAVDLLVEMSNPGPWMLHCHIAEHLQSGMMMTINVEEL
jgi:FtsP/CotA-like multicopper oxidase with cupredoxin domain